VVKCARDLLSYVNVFVVLLKEEKKEKGGGSRSKGAARLVSLLLSSFVVHPLLVFGLELVCERELGCLFLELGKFVFVLGDLLEGGLDEFALHV